jgi:hypothetical protein
MCGLCCAAVAVEAAVEVEEEVPTQVSDDVGAFAESHDVGDEAGMGGGEWDDDNENTMQVSPFKPSQPVDHPTQVTTYNYIYSIAQRIDTGKGLSLHVHGSLKRLPEAASATVYLCHFHMFSLPQLTLFSSLWD